MAKVKVAEVAAIEERLDTLHRSAAQGDRLAYLSCFFLDAVFVGTDASEYWSFKEFAEVVAKHFRDGKGWTYVPFERNVKVIPNTDVAYFYERLSHAEYVEARGSGVLIKRGGVWVISQYVLSLPIPNSLFDAIVAQIRTEQQ